MGGVIGGLSRKYKVPSAAVGAALGGLFGREIGKKSPKMSITSVSEGTIKKQEKRKDSAAKVPRLTDDKVLKLIKK